MNLNSTGKQLDVFDGKARVLHTGTEFGCVHPSDSNFANQFERIREISGQDRILAQKLGFNTKVTPISGIDELEQGKVENFFRTPIVSDGVVVSLTGDTLMKIAVMIMNADCGTIEILAPNGEIAVLHGGFDNIDNKDGTSIVGNAIKYFEQKGFRPQQLKFRVGESAQACCYGLNNPAYQSQNEARRDKMVQDYGSDVVRPVRNLPRSENGGIGFDVSLIAARQADLAGIRDIEVEGLCTSCHGLVSSTMGTLDSFGTWYSNLRENPVNTKTRGYGMRNAVVVYSR
ncbi:laccase domain-containing protein [Candidatus Gracilibacteria bacterium]|nr:laccase domain-containing protein [Candidatus Gracilibacteria bacterium]